jgi:hypothetical protein
MKYIVSPYLEVTIVLIDKFKPSVFMMTSVDQVTVPETNRLIPGICMKVTND